MPETPAGKLTPGAVYSYTAFTKDAANATSPSTPVCYFVIDTAAPAVPKIESTDFPDAADPVIEALRAKAAGGSFTPALDGPVAAGYLHAVEKSADWLDSADTGEAGAPI